MANKRGPYLKGKLVKLLREKGQLNTLQIRDAINETSKHGTTMSELGNALGKDHDFAKVGQEIVDAVAGPKNGNYPVWIWAYVGD